MGWLGVASRSTSFKQALRDEPGSPSLRRGVSILARSFERPLPPPLARGTHHPASRPDSPPRFIPTRAENTAVFALGQGGLLWEAGDLLYLLGVM